jgi:hypothetical protein
MTFRILDIGQFFVDIGQFFVDIGQFFNFFRFVDNWAICLKTMDYFLNIKRSLLILQTTGCATFLAIFGVRWFFSQKHPVTPCL